VYNREKIFSKNSFLYKSDLNVQSDSNLNEKDYHSSCYTNSNIRLHKKQNQNKLSKTFHLNEDLDNDFIIIQKENK
jgi:hypothetical protein